LTKVLADDLDNNQFSSLIEFMKSAPIGKLARRGKRIEIDGLTNKKVKFLLNKFLHINHLSEYGVVDTTAAFEIVHIKPEPERLEKRGPLKHPVPYGPYLPCVVKPRLRVEWQGKPTPRKKR
jgi:hypothetical protein